MRHADFDGVLAAATDYARGYFASLPARRVYPDAEPAVVRGALDVDLPDDGEPPAEVVRRLAEAIDPYVAAHASGRYFGFVIGGLHPAAYGAELLVSTWDQNAGLYASTPGVSTAEAVAAEWVLDVLRLPASCSVGFVTGGQMATFTCLAAARDDVLRAVGWDVEADGLRDAPRVHVVTKSGRHSTLPRALRYLGLGERNVVEVPCDDQDRLRPDALRATLETLDGPTIVCCEAGNVNTGAFDPFPAVADAVDAHRDRGNPSWTHCDGAVGLFAAASPGHRPLVDGVDRLDSWSTDAHKLLNVAYDSGIAICRRSAPHRAAMAVQASYLIQERDDVRDPMDWNPEFSRRARGVGVYATLRSLGRTGLAELVGTATAMARRLADGLCGDGRAELVNDVVFNQALVRWLAPDGVDPDAFNDDVVRRVQRDGEAFFSGTTWRGRRIMRVSVSDAATDEDDVDRAVATALRCARAAAPGAFGAPTTG